jgi:hypothetical protein
LVYYLLADKNMYTHSLIRHIIHLITVLLIIATGVQAGVPADDLQPNEGVFSVEPAFYPYFLALREALLSEHRIRKCQVLTIPSFDKEWAVYLVQDNFGSTQVILKIMKVHLAADMMRTIFASSSPTSLDGPTQTKALSKITKDTERIAVSLPPSTARLLELAWVAMLNRIKYPDNTIIGKDGTNYYIAHWQEGYGYRSGTTWSPRQGTHTGSLVDIAQSLRNYALATPEERTRFDSILSEKAKALLAKLGANIE